MNNKEVLKPTILVIFGASGDLNERKLTPAFYNLFLDKQMPEKFAIIGLGRTDFTDAKFRSVLEDGICLLYTSPSPRDLSTSRMPSSA